MQPKFDIGDIVLILDLTDEQKRNYEPSWVRGMNEYINQQAVILDKTEVRNQYRYKINLDSGFKVRENSWTFEEYVLEPYTDNC